MLAGKRLTRVLLTREDECCWWEPSWVQADGAVVFQECSFLQETNLQDLAQLPAGMLMFPYLLIFVRTRLSFLRMGLSNEANLQLFFQCWKPFALTPLYFTHCLLYPRDYFFLLKTLQFPLLFCVQLLLA